MNKLRDAHKVKILVFSSYNTMLNIYKELQENLNSQVVITAAEYVGQSRVQT